MVTLMVWVHDGFTASLESEGIESEEKNFLTLSISDEFWFIGYTDIM